MKAGDLKRETSAKAGGKDPDDKALRAEAEKLFDEMTYNERQTYVKEHLEEEPGETKEQAEKRKYPDGSARPVFVHVGPELSGIGQKLTSGRTVEQARQWLLDWVKGPRHYSAYTIMPPAAERSVGDRSDRILLAQSAPTTAPTTKWKAGTAEVDTPGRSNWSRFSSAANTPPRRLPRRMMTPSSVSWPPMASRRRIHRTRKARRRRSEDALRR
jgi:hypothetical protein